VDYSFTAWGQCRNASCKQEFAIAGNGGLEPEQGPDNDFTWEKYFSPKTCYPMPEIFNLPIGYPEQVKEQLHAAFSAFWIDRGACAGRIRVALERLMDYLGVPKRRRVKNNTYSALMLHDWIDLYAKSEPMTGAQLMALKWLGNTGSHDSVVTRSDLLDAFEVMEHALGEIVEKRSARISELAKKLAKKHKPSRRRRKG
jgi:hypothetical protein